MNPTLLHKHKDYIRRARADDANIILYVTPCCGKDLETTAPKDSQVWDSLTSCPYCGQLFMKVCRRFSVSVSLAPPTVAAGLDRTTSGAIGQP